MNNFIEYKDNYAFHPGYYVDEIIQQSGISQEEFAKKLNTTPKNLSLLVRGRQKLSSEMALKLSSMLGTSIKYWLNLQASFDAIEAEIAEDKDREKEFAILKLLGYDYFRKNFKLPSLQRKLKEQVKELCKFLKVANLTVLKSPDLNVSYRCSEDQLSPESVIRANALMQIAINEALEIESPSFNKKKFRNAYEYALTLTEKHDSFLPLIEKAFKDAGVILVVLPHMKNSKLNGATKKIGSRVLLMVSDRNVRADIFWFTLFHEIGHIVNNDFGISLDCDSGIKEEIADEYAANCLIDKEAYEKFIEINDLTISSIKRFASKINRDPGIVVGRLRKDGLVRYDDISLNTLVTKYKVEVKKKVQLNL